MELCQCRHLVCSGASYGRDCCLYTVLPPSVVFLVEGHNESLDIELKDRSSDYKQHIFENDVVKAWERGS